MNYIKLYKNLCAKKYNSDYTEKHRITPGCMGGRYTSKNTAILSAKAHYIAHWLLTKIYPKNDKLIFAFWMMNVCKDNNQPRYKSSKGYETAKKLMADNMSRRFTGKGNNMYGISLPRTLSNVIAGSKWKGMSEQDVIKMVRNIYIDPRLNEEIGKQYGINHASVWRIKNDLRWSKYTKDLTAVKNNKGACWKRLNRVKSFG